MVLLRVASLQGTSLDAEVIEMSECTLAIEGFMQNAIGETEAYVYGSMGQAQAWDHVLRRAMWMY